MRNGLGWTWETDHGANQRKEMQILLQVSRARKRRQIKSIDSQLAGLDC